MNTREAVADRIKNLCKEQGITPNALSYRSGVPQSTIKSILNNETQNPGIVTIKNLCDGLDISLYDFFDTDIFRTLEQEIK
ncbi:MAG: helix-turn-helix transcriptional regulator [Oscillospiraceae bacterium]|nr:helix-turn-helix transcriptional regulator [Oscillospiraceae bacterium]